MKINFIKSKTQFNAEQKCNFYRDKLRRLETINTEGYSTFDMDEILREMEYYSYLIDLYAMESLEEWLYLPTKKIRLKSIQDLIYFERLYGLSIYEKKDYPEKEEKR